MHHSPQSVGWLTVKHLVQTLRLYVQKWPGKPNEAKQLAQLIFDLGLINEEARVFLDTVFHIPSNLASWKSGLPEALSVTPDVIIDKVTNRRTPVMSFRMTP